MLAWNLNLQLRFRFRFSSRPGILFPLKVVLLVLIILIIISSRSRWTLHFIYPNHLLALRNLKSSWGIHLQKMAASFICASSSWYTWISGPHSCGLVSSCICSEFNVGETLPRRLLASCLQLSVLGPILVFLCLQLHPQKAECWPNYVFNMLPSSTCIWSPSKSSSSSAIGWWRFHCFILRLCCWWQASRNLSWWRSCSLLIHGFANLKVTVWQ